LDKSLMKFRGRLLYVQYNCFKHAWFWIRNMWCKYRVLSLSQFIRRKI
jgi:hypothetical protein